MEMKKHLLLWLLMTLLCYGVSKAQTLDTILHNKNGDFTLHGKDTIWTDGRKQNKSYATGERLLFVASGPGISTSTQTPTWITINPFMVMSATKEGKYIIHIKKRRLKWLNDSTAIYTPIK